MRATFLILNKPKEIPGIVSKEDLKKVRSYQLIVAGLLFTVVPSIELYRRIYLGGERKIQQGQYNPKDGTIRDFTEEEKVEVFKNSWFTKIFGEK